MSDKSLQPIEQKTITFYDDEITAVVIEGTDMDGLVIPRMNDLMEDIDWQQVHAPENARIAADARLLAEAFVRQMMAEAHEAGRSPLIGEFVMNPPEYLPLVYDLNLSHIRLLIRSDGIWCSLVFPDGSVSPGWWSPNYNNLIVVFGEKAAWMMRVFLSCLWRDATVVKKQAFRLKRIRTNTARGFKDDTARAIVLPRTIRQMEWGDEETQMYYSGEARKTSHGVRAHYRKLAKSTWKASPEAVMNADQSGFPAPPDGFTFVQAYDVEGSHVPRIVARGLASAAVALSRLG